MSASGSEKLLAVVFGNRQLVFDNQRHRQQRAGPRGLYLQAAPRATRRCPSGTTRSTRECRFLPGSAGGPPARGEGSQPGGSGCTRPAAAAPPWYPANELFELEPDLVEAECLHLRLGFAPPVDFNPVDRCHDPGTVHPAGAVDAYGLVQKTHGNLDISHPRCLDRLLLLMTCAKVYHRSDAHRLQGGDSLVFRLGAPIDSGCHATRRCSASDDPSTSIRSGQRGLVSSIRQVGPFM